MIDMLSAIMKKQNKTEQQQKNPPKNEKTYVHTVYVSHVGW